KRREAPSRVEGPGGASSCRRTISRRVPSHGAAGAAQMREETKPMAWYVGTVILGAIGILAVVRACERLAFGGGTGPVVVQALVGLSALVGAWTCLRKARRR